MPGELLTNIVTLTGGVCHSKPHDGNVTHYFLRTQVQDLNCTAGADPDQGA